MNTDHMTDAWIDSGQYCAQDVANLRDCITALQSRLEAAEGENGRLKEMKLPIPDGDWLGKFGDCKLCGGEIPYGHTDNCHIWKMEQKVTSLQSQLTSTESRAQQAEEMAGRVVEALSWALDLLDMYDKRLVDLGEPEDRVYSPIHLDGKKRARRALSHLNQSRRRRPTT
jgi:hypothetical protein